MTSLFSPFDYGFFYFTPLLLSSFLIYFFYSIFLFNLFNSLYSLIALNLKNFFLTLKSKSWTKLSLVFLFSVMLLILSMNFLSIYSFVFPFSSQFGPIFSMGVTVWFSFILFSFIKSFKNSLSHFIPEGTPLLLVPFLFIIETLSNLIRPLTLSVRLVANILSGHLLMILLSLNVFNFPFSFLPYTFLNLVEIFVSLIQSYIFCTMITLYYSEVC